MRILMLAPQPFLEPRGTPLSVCQRIQALSALGHEVDLVTYHVGKDVQIPGLQIYRIPRTPFIKEVKVGPSWIKPWLDLLLFFVALKLLFSRRYEVIHSHEEAAFIAVLLSSLFGIRHIYDMHSSLPRQLKNFNFGNWTPLVYLFDLLERWVINTCDAVITIGADLEALVREINPHVTLITIENMPVYTNNATADNRDMEQLKQQLALQGLLPIVYTGTFEAYQGLDLLLESACIVVNENPKARFLLVGGKLHQISHWQQVAEQMGIAGQVQFMGTVPMEEASLYLKLAEVLVSPRTGGTSVPLKIYSYLHAGKATVATKLTAHTHVLNQDVAYLVEPTKEALAAGILKLLDDSDLRHRLGQRAQQFAEEKYSLANYLEKLRKVYQFQVGLVDIPESALVIID
ncbi:MAG: glycosyltransferase family 4 protein [Anaerolinea sp.]|nr:glycosyltransferase family 4 protein [Anaerolinea sp.]